MDDHPSQPERLSSVMTPYLRTVVPPATVVCLGVVAVGISLGYFDPTVPPVVRGLALAVWMVLSVLAFKWFRSFRHVWLDGDDLLVDNGERRVRIPLREVADVRQSHLQKTKTITLDLTRNTPLGDKVRFVPHFALRPGFMDHPVARELRERRERALAGGDDDGRLPGSGRTNDSI